MGDYLKVASTTYRWRWITENDSQLTKCSPPPEVLPPSVARRALERPKEGLPLADLWHYASSWGNFKQHDMVGLVADFDHLPWPFAPREDNTTDADWSAFRAFLRQMFPEAAVLTSPSGKAKAIFFAQVPPDRDEVWWDKPAVWVTRDIAAATLRRALENPAVGLSEAFDVNGKAMQVSFVSPQMAKELQAWVDGWNGDIPMVDLVWCGTGSPFHDPLLTYLEAGDCLAGGGGAARPAKLRSTGNVQAGEAKLPTPKQKGPLEALPDLDPDAPASALLREAEPSKTREFHVSRPLQTSLQRLLESLASARGRRGASLSQATSPARVASMLAREAGGLLRGDCTNLCVTAVLKALPELDGDRAEANRVLAWLVGKGVLEVTGQRYLKGRAKPLRVFGFGPLARERMKACETRTLDGALSYLRETYPLAPSKVWEHMPRWYGLLTDQLQLGPEEVAAHMEANCTGNQRDWLAEVTRLRSSHKPLQKATSMGAKIARYGACKGSYSLHLYLYQVD